jgi:hypothetical protein
MDGWTDELNSARKEGRKVSCDTRALPIKTFKRMKREIHISGNVLMSINSVMDGKISVMDDNRNLIIYEKLS